MTVQELIDKLAEMPRDALVSFDEDDIGRLLKNLPPAPRKIDFVPQACFYNKPKLAEKGVVSFR